MFTNPTVFVLGAGASWHYGYPTGADLVERVISMTNRLSDYCHQRLRSGQTMQLIPEYVEQKSGNWEGVAEECQSLIERLRSIRPILIDHFLAWNESLRPIGKFMIAAAILECEAIWLRERANQNHRLILANAPMKPSDEDLKRLDITKYHDDWHRFLVHKLAYGCRTSGELFHNNVHFVTFNYDTSLEYHLFRALSSIDLFRPADVEKFLTENRIVHIYGSVHAQIPKDGDAISLDTAENLAKPFADPLNHATEFEPRKALLDKSFTASKNLRTIDPHDKGENKELLELACQWIAGAKVVYFLGYGFDQDNNRRIGLETSLLTKSDGAAVMVTNYQNINTINKTVSNLRYRQYDVLTDRLVYGNPFGGNYTEKSLRTVYEALEKDFYALESQ
jgi:hypothetical protein